MAEKIRGNLKKIKAVVFDADGVLFTGRVFVDKSGEVMKERSHIDGQGISSLRGLGIKIAFVTGEKSEFLSRVCDKLNSLPSVQNGNWDKVGCFLNAQGEDKVKFIDKWLREKEISWQECAAMGDDLADYQMLKKAAFAAAPAQAEKIIKNLADYVTEREGGNGAIRDFCNLILEARKVDFTTLKLK